MNNQIADRRIRFRDELKYLNFDEEMKSSATMTFIQRASMMNRMGKENVNFKDVPKKVDLGECQTYAEVWEETGPVLKQTIQIDKLIMEEIINREREVSALGEEMLNRLEEVQEALLYYVRLTFLNSFFADVSDSVDLALRERNWDAIKEVITLMEVEYCPLKDFEFQIMQDKIKYREIAYNQVVEKAKSTVLSSYEGTMTNDFLNDCMRRWRNQYYFFLQPIELYNKAKSKFVKLYFSIFDTGIKLSLINNVIDNGKIFARNFIDWKFPDELLLEEPYRVLFPPLVCADREFSCNFPAPGKSSFPEYRTIEDIRSLPDEFVSKIALAKQPGKLLLLLIRMNLTTMVFFCIENGLNVNLRADTGHCMSLKWIEEERQVEDDDGELRSSKRHVLEKEYSFETPLSVAAETAVYGAGTEIVLKLLAERANPLLCSDIAIKRCINAVSLLATPKNVRIKSIPCPDLVPTARKVLNSDNLSKTVEELAIEPSEPAKAVEDPSVESVKEASEKLVAKTDGNAAKEAPNKRVSGRFDSKNRRRQSNVAQKSFFKRKSINEETLESKNPEIRAIAALRRKSGASVKSMTSNFEKKPSLSSTKPEKKYVPRKSQGRGVHALASTFEKKASQKSISSVRSQDHDKNLFKKSSSKSIRSIRSFEAKKKEPTVAKQGAQELKKFSQEKKKAQKVGPNVEVKGKERTEQSIESLRARMAERKRKKAAAAQGRIDSFDIQQKDNKKSSAVTKGNKLESINSVNTDDGAVKPEDKRIHSGSSASSAGSKSPVARKKSRGKRNFAKRRERFKKGLRAEKKKSRKKSKADSEFDLRNPHIAAKRTSPEQPILRRGPRHVEEDQDLPKSAKESIARVRASRVLKKMLKASENYKKIKKNYFTKVLLYQACLEGREEAIRVILESKNMQKMRQVRTKRINSEVSAATEAESVTTWSINAELPLSILQAQGVLDEDNFDLIVFVVDKFLNDGLNKVYPNYDSVLRPIYIIMRRYKLFPNNWRFVQLFHIVKLAMKQNLAGDRDIILKFLQLPQMQHYLNLKKRSIWERVRFENKLYGKSKRAELKIEAPTMSNDQLFDLDETNLTDTSLTRQEIVPKETGQIDKLFKYATRMESLPIIECLVDAGATPATKTAGHMMAMSVKSQNVSILMYVYDNFNLKQMLTKAFIIALKGKYHQSMDAIFKLGFSIHPEEDRNGTEQKFKKARSLTNSRLRQLLSLFSKAIDDVLFERTVFDQDDGRRHKYNFTRQDEEETFYLLVQFLFNNVSEDHLDRIVQKIVTRAKEAHESRIWFYGFHYLLREIVNNKYYGFITPLFITVYKLNYGQWLMYIRELENKFRREREREFREKALNKSSLKKRLMRAAEKPKNSPIDNEAFVTMAKSKVRRTLKQIFTRNHENIAELKRATDEVKELVKATQGTEKTPREAVRTNCRRSGSRNYDFISFNNAMNGTSDFI